MLFVGFAVISCTAAHLRASIPWSKLEKEPTKLELVGLQLICVPLLPSNAIKIHGAGTEKDPKCTLRTRVKRSAIARFERNFFSWRIPGEGPPRPNHNNHGDEQHQRKKRGNGKRSSGDSVYSKTNFNDDGSFMTNADESKDDISALTNNTFDDDDDEEDAKQPTAWRAKLVQKLFRNIEISIRDLHVRCEVGQGALNSGPQQSNERIDKQPQNKDYNDNDESAFAFGIHFDALVLKSANSNWSTGRMSSSETDIVVDNVKYKVFMVKDISMYWDDEPPIILTECPLLHRTESGDTHKVWSIVRLALNNMREYQDPGSEISSILLGEREYKQRINQITKEPIAQDEKLEQRKKHSYIINPSTLEVRLKFHNLGQAETTQCQAELMSCALYFNFNPKQMRQYRAIQYGMFAQQRLDTMLQQRPLKSPIEDPRAWWKYAISCVITRPNARVRL